MVEQTPLQYSRRLSELYGADVYLKREDLQAVRSYKIRGAYNLMSSLSESERAQGVVCASAGNHAQGVAVSCSKLHIQGKIYMPEKHSSAESGASTGTRRTMDFDRTGR